MRDRLAPFARLCSFLALGVLSGCGGPAASRPTAPPPARPAAATAGLRVALSGQAKSVCVAEQGCAEGPLGAFKLRPLEPEFQAALRDTLHLLGFELVDGAGERDLVADVEWRGTDTIALRLRDGRGRLIDQASFSRSLDRCRDLPQLTWGSCWAANFEGMKQALSAPLEKSPALLDFARKLKSASTSPGDSTAAFASPTEEPPPPPADAGELPNELDGAAIERTLGQYRRELERSCWQPALEAREPSAPTAARVGTIVTIGPSGRVDGVTTDGDPVGYLHLSSCVASQVKTWRFPAARRQTKAPIPFVFASD